MKKYKVLEHRADLKLRVFGKTKEELFLNAVLAMESSLRPKIRSTKSAGRKADSPKGCIRNIKVKSDNLETLLVDFLSEILYLTQVNKEVYSNVRFKKFSDTEIEAELSGPGVESFGEDIKAVTYHNLDVRQNKGGDWEAVILFDI